MIVVVLAILAIPGKDHFNLLGHGGTAAALLLLGGAAGLFAVPIQVFLQTRPPETLKGRMERIKMLSDEDLKEIDKEIRGIDNEAAQYAQDSPEPDPSELWTDIRVEA